MKFITSNPKKVQEAKAILGTNYDIDNQNIDLVEIQSVHVKYVTKHKVEEAAKSVAKGEPFFVEDTGLYIKDLGDFPGALVKYLMESIGSEGIARIAGGSRAVAETVIGYKDGNGNTKLFRGRRKGHIARIPRGNGHGWDPIFIPTNLDKRTYAEMSPEEKNATSHRMRAFMKFKRFLESK